MEWELVCLETVWVKGGCHRQRGLWVKGGCRKELQQGLVDDQEL